VAIIADDLPQQRDDLAERPLPTGTVHAGSSVIGSSRTPDQ
jgi:hypothetical protein